MTDTDGERGGGGATERGSICVSVPKKWRLMCVCAYVRVTVSEGVSVSTINMEEKGEKKRIYGYFSHVFALRVFNVNLCS